MGQNWWFLFSQISVVLTFCLLIQGDIDKEGDFLWKNKAERPHLVSPGFCESSPQLTDTQQWTLSCITDFRWFRDKMRNCFALSSAFSDFWPWMAPYVPGIRVILGTSPLLTVLCRWGEWRLPWFPLKMKYMPLLFPVIQVLKKIPSYRGCHLPVAAAMEAACPRKLYFHPIPASLSIGTAEVRLHQHL